MTEHDAHVYSDATGRRKKSIFDHAAGAERFTGAGAAAQAFGGGIRVDGRDVYTDYMVAPGETVELDISSAEPECDIVPENGSLDVLYEDAGLIAVNKPAGLITHPSRARYTGTLANFVAGYLQDKTGDARCHAVNRLDRDTSGIVLFAENSHMKALASQALGAPEAEKEYRALVWGVFDPPGGVIDSPIKRLHERDMLRGVAPDGQKAVTHYETLGIFEAEGVRVSLLRLVLETGSNASDTRSLFGLRETGILGDMLVSHRWLA